MFNGFIVTLIAFVWLLSTVYFQMFYQSTCPRGCKITLVALVWHWLHLFVILFWLVSVSLLKWNKKLLDRILPELNRIWISFVYFWEKSESEINLKKWYNLEFIMTSPCYWCQGQIVFVNIIRIIIVLVTIYISISLRSTSGPLLPPPRFPFLPHPYWRNPPPQS